jgi:hypothetical protein
MYSCTKLISHKAKEKKCKSNKPKNWQDYKARRSQECVEEKEGIPPVQQRWAACMVFSLLQFLDSITCFFFSS